jgi:hypothetical protein
MKILNYILILLLIFIPKTWAQSFDKNFAKKFSREQLHYSMFYLNMNIAQLDFSLIDSTSDPNYQLLVEAHATALATKFFKLENTYMTFFSRTNLLPQLAKKKIMQKNIQHELVIRFDHQQQQARLNDSLSWAIPQPCFDYFSMLYFLRSLHWLKGDTLHFFLDSEFLISKVEAALLPDRETLQLRCGNFAAIKIGVKFDQLNFEPRPWKTDILTNRLAKPGSKLIIWLSDDEHHLPLKISYTQSLVNTTIVLNSFSRR